MSRNKDWGKPPSPDDVAQQMNAIDKLVQDVEQSRTERDQVARELARRETMLKTARDELGRMLKASRHLENSDFRVVHYEEATGGDVGHLFGIGRVR